MLNTLVGRIVASMLSEEHHVQNSLIHDTNGGFLIIREGRPPLAVPSDFEHNTEKSLGFLIAGGSEHCTTLTIPASQNYAFYSEEENFKLSEVIRMVEVKLQTEHVIFGHTNLQYAEFEWKWSHGFLYHLYLIPKVVQLKNMLAFSYAYLIQRNVRKLPRLL